jgi:hypothetical protein
MKTMVRLWAKLRHLAEKHLLAWLGMKQLRKEE